MLLHRNPITKIAWKLSLASVTRMVHFWSEREQACYCAWSQPDGQGFLTEDDINDEARYEYVAWECAP
jgi:hypothetical protein